MAGQQTRAVTLTLVAKDLASRAFRSAGRAAKQFADDMDKSSRRVRTASLVAASGILAINSAASIGGAAVAIFAGAIAALPIALAGVGIAGALMNDKVQKAFKGLKEQATATLKDIGEPLVGPLIRGAESLGRAFQLVAPYLKQISEAAAPLVDGFFAKVEEFAAQIGPKLPAMFANAIPVVEGFVVLFSQVGKAIGRFFGGDASLLDGEKLKGIFTDMGEAIAGFLDRVRKVGKFLEPFISQLVTGLRPVVDAVVKAFDKLLEKLQPVSDWFKEHPTVIQAIGTAIGIVTVALTAFSVVMAVVNAVMLASPFTWIVIGIVALIAAIVLIIKHWDKVKAVMSALWAWIKDVFGAAWDWLKDKVVAAVDGIKAGATAAWDNVKQTAGNLVEWFTGLPGRIKKAIGNVAKLLLEKGKDVLRGLADGAKWVWDHTLLGFIINRRQAIVRAIGNVGRLLFQKGKDILGSLKDGAVWVWDHTVKPWLNLGGKITRAVGSLSRVLYSAGKNILIGLYNGLVWAWDKYVKPYLEWVTDKIPDWKGPKARDAKLLTDSGRIIMESLVPGFKEGVRDVERYLAGFTGDLASTLNVSVDPLAAGAGGPQVIHIRLSAEQISQLQRGREIQADLDAYHGAGGRKRS